MAHLLAHLGDKALARYRLQCSETALIQAFIVQGPLQLQKLLQVNTHKEWQELFDYLVIEKKVLSRCPSLFADFFANFIIKNGLLALIQSLHIDAPYYDQIVREIVDSIGITHGALYKHVEYHAQEYGSMILAGKAACLRKLLYINDAQYDAVWYEIVELLQKNICVTVIEEHLVEQQIRSWTTMMNAGRVYQGLAKKIKF